MTTSEALEAARAVCPDYSITARESHHYISYHREVQIKCFLVIFNNGVQEFTAPTFEEAIEQLKKWHNERA